MSKNKNKINIDNISNKIENDEISKKIVKKNEVAFHFKATSFFYLTYSG